MKKYICILLFCTAIVAACAQDTVHEWDPWYMSKNHDTLSYMHCNDGGYGSHMILYYGKDSVEIEVYGIAITQKYIAVEEDRSMEAITLTPSVILLEQVAYGNPPIVSIIDSANVFGLIKECNFVYYYGRDSVVAHSYEYYFDNPHRFNLPEDTFYVMRWWPAERTHNCSQWFSEHYPLGDLDWCSHYYGVMEHGYPTPEYWEGNGNYGNGPLDFFITTAAFNHRWGYLFPIVNLRCAAPHPGFVGREGNTATLSWWQAEAGENYQFSLGTYGSNPDSGLMTTTVDTFHTVTDLQPDVIYQAWVRKACHYTTAGYDTIVWSDWSHPATFRIGVGISDVEDDAAFTLAPNPAHGTAVLTLAEAAEGAELTLCDLGGRELRREQVTGTTHSLDVSALPSGVYLLKLTTPQGVAIRRLLVE